MNLEEQTRVLERAAEPALTAIAEDEARAPKWLRPLFAQMRELLFAPDLKLELIQEAAGYADPEVWTAVAEELEQPAWSYLRDARLETAAHLLLETEISISEIGYLVGYSSPSTFRRPLHDFLGMPPSRYRRQAPKLLERAGPPPGGAGTNAYWERMLAGELTGGEARELDDYFGRLAPGSAPDAATREDDERMARLRRTLAGGLAEALDDPKVDDKTLNFAEQRQLVRDAVWFPDGSFFEHLSELSAAAEDPERGVELARLAVDSVEANRLLEVHPGRRALAWARLARARWRAGDPRGAEQDLERSAREAAQADEIPATWEAERSRVAAALLWQSGRRRQALPLAESSVAEHRAAGSDALAHALVLRAELRAAVAELEADSAGERTAQLRRALGDLEEARGLDAARSPALRCSSSEAALSLWIRLLARLGSRSEIAAALPALRQAAEDSDPGLAPRLRWLEGHAVPAADATGAETLWRAARQGFTDLGDELWVARATLDLGRLCLAAERPGETAALASELASILSAHTADREDLTALGPLARAAPFTAVRASELDRAEAVLRRLEWPRRARRALDLAG